MEILTINQVTKTLPLNRKQREINNMILQQWDSARVIFVNQMKRLKVLEELKYLYFCVQNYLSEDLHKNFSINTKF